MREEYYVVVVGAGPAGSTAARIAAQECDVLLVEKRQEIGAPVRCAEGVPLVPTPGVFHESFTQYVTPHPAWIACDSSQGSHPLGTEKAQVARSRSTHQWTSRMITAPTVRSSNDACVVLTHKDNAPHVECLVSFFL